MFVFLSVYFFSVFSRFFSQCFLFWFLCFFYHNICVQRVFNLQIFYHDSTWISRNTRHKLYPFLSLNLISDNQLKFRHLHSTEARNNTKTKPNKARSKRNECKKIPLFWYQIWYQFISQTITVRILFKRIKSHRILWLFSFSIKKNVCSLWLFSLFVIILRVVYIEIVYIIFNMIIVL